MKKVLVLLLAVFMAFSVLTACGNNEEETQTEEKSTQEKVTTEDATQEKKEEEDLEEIELSFWIWDDAQAPFTQEMIDYFTEQHPNITIELTSIAGVTDYNTKIQAVIGSNAAPSVFWLNFNLGREYIPAGVVQDLTDYIEADDSFDINALNAGITEAYTFDGRIYAIAKDTDSYAVYYNKGLFDSAGAEYPDSNWTLKDFAETAALTTTETTVGWTNSTSDRVYTGFIISNGGAVYNEEGTESLINSAEAVEAVQICMDMMNSGHAYNGAQLNEMDSSSAFCSELAAMVIDGSWMISSFSEALGENLGIVELPSGSAGKASVGHGIGYATTTSNEYLDETWMFLSYLGSNEAQELQVEVVIPAANESAATWAKVYPDLNVDAFVNALEYSTPIPLAKTNPTLARNEVKTAVANILAGQYADAQEALDAAKAAIDSAINE